MWNSPMSPYSGRDPGITIVRLSLVLTGFLMILLLASPVTASAVPGLKDPIQLVNTGFAFGSSVALGAGLALVGAKGLASLFDAHTGSLLFTVGRVQSGFSVWSVAVGDGLLVIGVSREPSQYFTPLGNAYVFNSTTGGLVYNLTSPNPEWGGFGLTVGMGDGLIVVGAPFENLGAENAYVFNDQTGTLMFTLTSPNPPGLFGSSVNVDHGLIVVGAPYDQESAGSVYVFNDNNGSLLLTLTNPNPSPVTVYGRGGFGSSVSIGDGLIVAGAPYEGAVGLIPPPGNAFVFNARTGSLVSTLANPDAQRGGLFGWSVSVSGGIIAVGAPQLFVRGYAAAGEAFVFNAHTGSLRSVLTSPNLGTGERFGWSVSVDQSLVLVGAPNAFDFQTGSAYLFK